MIFPQYPFAKPTRTPRALRGYRLCDVQEDKPFVNLNVIYHTPNFRESRAFIFRENRKTQISLWEWTASPSKNDSVADYVTASLSYETPIKAIRCSWAEKHRQIVKRLKADGIEIAIPSCRTLFIARDSSGIIVEANDLAEIAGNVRLKNKFLKLLLIDNISEHQLIECENRVAKTSHTFYYTLYPQNTSSLLLNLRNIIAKATIGSNVTSMAPHCKRLKTSQNLRSLAIYTKKSRPMPAHERRRAKNTLTIFRTDSLCQRHYRRNSYAVLKKTRAL